MNQFRRVSSLFGRKHILQYIPRVILLYFHSRVLFSVVKSSTTMVNCKMDVRLSGYPTSVAID